MCLIERYLKNYITKDNISFFQVNDYETELAYGAIFNNKIYEDDTIVVNENDVIVDIGANIGLYPLYLYSEKNLKNLNIYCFEPSYVAYNVLEKNMKLYFENAALHKVGISDKKGYEEFAIYPNFTIGSASLELSSWGEKMFRDNIIGKVTKGKNFELNNSHFKYIDKLTKIYMQQEIVKCPVETISDVIRVNGINRIDVLKINAENSEWKILQSINNEDWDIIRQLIIEVHDEEDMYLHKIKELLVQKGYHVTYREDVVNPDSDLKVYLIYASKVAS